MNRQLLSLLCLGCAASTSFAQVGMLDQSSPIGGGNSAGFFPVDGFNYHVWQQQVRCGKSGLLEGFKVVFNGMSHAEVAVSVRTGDGWNTSPPVFSTLLTTTVSGYQTFFVDTTSANIVTAPGSTFVIEMKPWSSSQFTLIVGSHSAPPAAPFYPEPMFKDGPGCYLDCGWRIAFTTYVLPVAVPTTYCTAKLNSLGCTPAIEFTGFPNATSGSGFVVRATRVRNNKNGLLCYGVNGRTAVPFQGGTLCVKSPIRRTPTANSGGTPAPANDCSGVFALDMNAFATGALGGTPLPALSLSGTVVDCQWWGRDPGFPAPNDTTLSNGLEYTVP